MLCTSPLSSVWVQRPKTPVIYDKRKLGEKARMLMQEIQAAPAENLLDLRGRIHRMLFLEGLSAYDAAAIHLFWGARLVRQRHYAAGMAVLQFGKIYQVEELSSSFSKLQRRIQQIICK